METGAGRCRRGGSPSTDTVASHPSTENVGVSSHRGSGGAAWTGMLTSNSNSSGDHGLPPVAGRPAVTIQSVSVSVPAT